MSRATRVVEIEVSSTHLFKIPNTTSDEEAISIAESLLESGEDIGELLDTEIIDSGVLTTEEE